MYLDSGSGGGRITFGIASAQNTINSTTSGFAAYNTLRLRASQYLWLIGGSTTAMTLNAAGNVGIGITAPTTRLDIGNGTLTLPTLRGRTYTLSNVSSENPNFINGTGFNAIPVRVGDIIDLPFSQTRTVTAVTDTQLTVDSAWTTSFAGVNVEGRGAIVFQTNNLDRLTIAGTGAATFSSSVTSLAAAGGTFVSAATTGGSDVRITSGASSGFVGTASNHSLSFVTNNNVVATIGTDAAVNFSGRVTTEGDLRTPLIDSEEIVVTLGAVSTWVNVKTFTTTEKRMFIATVVATSTNKAGYAYSVFSKAYDGTNSNFVRSTIASSDITIDRDSITGVLLRVQATSSSMANQQVKVKILYLNK